MQGQAHKQAKPMLPLWLCPSQVRVIPVGAEHVAYCRKLTKTLCSKKIRADIDDRDKSMGKKIRDAEKQWIPYIIVAGDKEVNKTKVSVRVRGKANGTNKKDKSKNIGGENNIKQMTLAQLVKEIHGKTKAMPFMQMSVPAELSKRPIFVGTK
jgi:threonyl-tRNA synthetase